MSETPFVNTAEIKKAVLGHETEVLDTLGIAWGRGRPHIDCPYPDHGGRLDWRWDKNEAKAYCTCCTKGDSIFNVVAKIEGLADFEAAKIRVAQIIGRADLVIVPGKKADRTPVEYYMDPPSNMSDPAIPRRYLAARLGVDERDVVMPSTPTAGWRALNYNDPPAEPGGPVIKVGRWPAAVFGMVDVDGRIHCHRIYTKAGGVGKAELGTLNGEPRKAKKLAMVPTGENINGRSVIWGDPATAPRLVLAEGIETAAAIAYACRSEILADEIAVAAAITAGGIEAFRVYPATKEVVVAADRDEKAKPSHPEPTRRGEIAARKFGVANRDRVAVSITLPGDVGTSTDWLDVFELDGETAVRVGIENAVSFVATAAEIAEYDRLQFNTGHHGNGNGRTNGHTNGAGQQPDWLEPKPLPTGLSPVMAFDAETIPDSIGPWVADISDRMQCPPDFVAISAMIGLASVLGRRIAVHPQNKTDWIEVPNLWGVIVGRPGAMKSPAMNEALKPLNRLEADARKLNDEDQKRYATAMVAHKLRAEEAQRKAREALKANSNNNITGILGEVEEPEPPKPKRYITNDCSYEALGVVLANNPNGVLAFRDELVSLLKNLDREEHSSARGFFLTAWNGQSGYTFDRIVRGLTHVDAACISMLGSTQPGRFAEYLTRAVKGTAGDDGLIQRFSLMAWPDDSGMWKEVDRYPDSQARQTAWDTFNRLDRLTPDAAGAEQGEFDAIPHLRFNGDAAGIFGEWRGALEARLRSENLHPSIESHFAKYRKLVPSLALINHLADGGMGPIGEGSVLKALAFAEYLETHAKRAYGAGIQAEAATARSILAKIKKGDLVGEFTARDILQRDWSNLSDRDQVVSGLEILDDLNWIRSRKIDTGGRPKVSFTINPRGLA